MNKTIVYAVEVQFGDCDPAGIVFFPNFSRWMDAASHHYFRACGLAWPELPGLPGCVGAPLLEIHTRFLVAARPGDRLEVHSQIEEWRGKAFVQRHRMQRGADLICEGRETRALCVRLPDGRLKAVPVPDFVRDACAG